MNLKNAALVAAVAFAAGLAGMTAHAATEMKARPSSHWGPAGAGPNYSWFVNDADGRVVACDVPGGNVKCYTAAQLPG
jgi:hypothetical protein